MLRFITIRCPINSARVVGRPVSRFNVCDVSRRSLCTASTSDASAPRSGPKKSLTAMNPAIRIRRMTRRDRDDAKRVLEDGYFKFWEHIRYRKGWSTPPFERSAVEPMLEEAASYAVLIRRHLDEVNPGSKLRSVDGVAQSFLESFDPKAGGEGKAKPAINPAENPSEFVSGLVHATFQDARGYVEGQSRATIQTFLDELMAHRFDPRVHMKHLALEILDDVGRVPDNIAASDDVEKNWHDAIAQLRSAHDKLLELRQKEPKKKEEKKAEKKEEKKAEKKEVEK